MIKLYLDEDVHKKIAPALRIKGYDVISAHEIQKWGISDLEQIEYAVSQGRAIFTFNTVDFIKLHNKYFGKNKKHFGIILSKQVSLNETIVQLLKFLFNHSAKEIENNLFWI